jgi:pSer/pThr/pTyr-binding forkhead associated (FHA) protein
MSEETTRLPKQNFDKPNSLLDPATRQRWRLDSDRITIGRSDDNIVCLAADSAASGHHAQIYLEKGEYWLRDLGSSNGTLINDVSVTSPVRIKPGDHIVVGQTRLDVSSAY